jgi:hypothetical protein
MKDSIEVQLPGGDGLLIVSRVEKPRSRISFAVLDDLFLDLHHGPVIEKVLSQSRTMYIAD